VSFSVPVVEDDNEDVEDDTDDISFSLTTEEIYAAFEPVTPRERLEELVSSMRNIPDFRVLEAHSTTLGGLPAEFGSGDDTPLSDGYFLIFALIFSLICIGWR
jgi:hypothetical protein